MWPLTINEVSWATVEKIEWTITSRVKKWCLRLSEQHWPLWQRGPGITYHKPEYKYSKVKLQMTMKDSTDQTTSSAVPPLSTWKPTPPTTLVGKPSWEGQGSAIQQGKQFGIRLQYQSGWKLWFRRCADKIKAERSLSCLTGSMDEVECPGFSAGDTSEKWSQFHHQSSLKCSAIFKKPLSTVRQRSNLCPLPNSNNQVRLERVLNHVEANQIRESLAAAIENKQNSTNSLTLSHQLYHGANIYPKGQTKYHPYLLKPEIVQPVRAWNEHIFSPAIASTSLTWSSLLKSVHITETTAWYEKSVEEIKIFYILLGRMSNGEDRMAKSILLKWNAEV